MRNQQEAKKALYNAHALLTDLKSCSVKRDLQWGQRIHAKAVESGNDSNMHVATALIKMYAKCGSMVDARRAFDGIRKPDVVSWTALLMGYAENGEGRVALDLFAGLKARGCAIDSVTYVAALKACTSLVVDGSSSTKGYCLTRGREIHSEIGIQSNPFVQSSLIDMYAKCGSMVDARRVFDSIQKPVVVSWNALLLGYAENGDALAALEMFSRMKAAGVLPDSVTYLAALKACTSLAVNGGDSGKRDCLERGRRIHSEIGHRHSNHHVNSTLIDMYAKCGSMIEAHRVFDGIPNPVVVSWSALLLGYAENGEGLVVLDLFERMKARGCVPDSVTYIAVLKACSLIGALALGRKFHSEISELTSHLVTCLVDFYAKCGSMVEAREVFDLHSKSRDVSTWNALLAGYGIFGDTASVFDLFEAMQDTECRPDAVTFVCLLLCCSHAGLVQKASEYFEAMGVQYGITPGVMHYTCMVDVLGRANKLDAAIGVLRTMPCNPDAVTWRALLGACRKWKNVEIGRLAFQALVDMDKKDASTYVLMAQIYESRGLWNEQERVLETRRKFGDWKQAGEAYVTDEQGKMVKFGVGQEDSPEVEEKLEELCRGMKERGYVPQSYEEREGVVCGHCERRAVVFGILRTPFAEPVRVFKNTRMCDECHGSTKMISKILGRVIMVRDATRFHVVVNGSCSCGDYW